MSTRITVDCSACSSTQELAPSGLHLTVFDAGDGHFYEFFCPACYELVCKPAPEMIQSLLITADVDHTFEHVPLEVIERSGQAPALTVDDLMDFRLAMRQNARHMIEAARV